MMEKINSFEEVQALFQKIRNLKKGFITNFYPDPFRISLWCQYDCLFYVCYADTVFFLRDGGIFTNLFYCSVSESALGDDLSDLLQKQNKTVFVADLVSGEANPSCKQLFLSKGFEEHTSLIRMNRTGQSAVFAEEMELAGPEEATEADIPALMELYNCYFDPYSEQIPFKEELSRWIEAGHILIKRIEGKIAGFLIYDLSRSTLYLRYWFVHPDYRNHKIGSALFREFFYRGRNTVRQLFWVITSNENAIKRYVHYGFVPEKMFDYVLIKK